MPDAHDGVQRGHGLLEDHGDVAAAAAAHLGLGEGQQVDWGGRYAARPGRSKEDAAADLGLGGEQAQQGKRGGGLARAGLADQAEGLAGRDREGDAAHGLAAAEADRQVLDPQQRRCGCP